MKLLVLDLDGTITKSDNLVGFSLFMIKKRKARFLLILPLLLFLKLKLIDNLTFKTWYARLILSKMDVSLLIAGVKAFVHSEGFQKDLNPDVMKFIGEQKDSEAIIISANYDFIAKTLAESLSVAHCMCINLEVVNGRYTGKISGTVPQGAGKVEVYQQFAHDKKYDKTVGLGDSSSDLLLLKNLDEGYLVRFNTKNNSTSFELVSGSST